MLKELDTVALTTDLPEHSLRSGDIGAVVMVYDGDGFEVEFITLKGETIVVATLTKDQIRPIASGEIANARKVA